MSDDGKEAGFYMVPKDWMLDNDWGSAIHSAAVSEMGGDENTSIHHNENRPTYNENDIRANLDKEKETADIGEIAHESPAADSEDPLFAAFAAMPDGSVFEPESEAGPSHWITDINDHPQPIQREPAPPVPDG